MILSLQCCMAVPALATATGTVDKPTKQDILSDPTKPDFYRNSATADDQAERDGSSKPSVVQWPTVTPAVIVTANPPRAVINVNESDQPIKRIALGETLASGPQITAIHGQGIEMAHQGEKKQVRRHSCFHINQSPASERTTVRAGKCSATREVASP
ncbi:MAG: hypothetical protein HQL58_04295 [Magnetococcales bacterium]|nr:hypothetical protein [Magnetococcales bacterium]